MISFNINPADKEAGIRAYYSNVVPCPICKRPTNTMYSAEGRLILACSQECADERNLRNL